ncbi:ABC transporter permease [Clostridiaceae bacterium M8S5]|nr:ABC transporter permease [Clostridiaceae bacterium M8S5]
MTKKSNILEAFKVPLIAIILSFLIGSVFIIITGNNPIVAYIALLNGSLGSIPKIGETLLKSTPIILTGLSVAFAFKTNLFNIGAEGQYIAGAISTVVASYIFRGIESPFLLIPLTLLGGMLGGAIWASIAGVLKAKLGVHEVITSIMLNYIALFMSNYLVRVVLNPSVIEGTEVKFHSILIPEAARLTKLKSILPIFGYSSLNTSIFIAIACGIIAYFILYKTTMGYEIRAVGYNDLAAQYGGINVSKNMILSMAISGAFAGLAGYSQVAGLSFKVDNVAESPGYGLAGIAVALVGKEHPIGVIASGILFGILANGERHMQIAGIPKEVVGIIQAVIILFIAGDKIVKFFMKRKKEVA